MIIQMLPVNAIHILQYSSLYSLSPDSGHMESFTWGEAIIIRNELLISYSHNLDYKLGLMSVIYKWKENFIKNVPTQLAVVITNQWACEMRKGLGSYELLILYLFKDVLANIYWWYMNTKLTAIDYFMTEQRSLDTCASCITCIIVSNAA